MAVSIGTESGKGYTKIILAEKPGGTDRRCTSDSCTVPGSIGQASVRVRQPPPEKYRVMLQLFYYEEFSIREIAEVTALSEAAVKKRLSRGREMLREMLEKEGSGDV